MNADQNAYGFRPKRSAKDAIEQCFKALSFKRSATWILEGDIRACFDSISHKWLLEHTIMDRRILQKWLEAGYIERGTFCLTKEGTPQGGIISPTLLNTALSGLEKAIKVVLKRGDKVNVCIYADDFIISGANKEVLEEKIKPVVVTFLHERGLKLSEEKTKITSIHEGFDFLGFNVRKYKGKLLIKPSRQSVKTFLKDIRQIVKTNKSMKTEQLIQLLNPKIRGWANYFQHVVSKKTFNKVGHYIFQALWRWAIRRHPNKGSKWVKKRYFRSQDFQNWIFHAMTKSTGETPLPLDLYDIQKVPIKRHTKIRMDATPYNPAYDEYFQRREQWKKSTVIPDST